MIQFLTYGRVRLVRRTNCSCIVKRDEGVTHRYSLTGVRRVRFANSHDRRECVRRRVRRAESAAAALGRGFSRRRGTRRYPAGWGGGAEGAPGSRGDAFFPHSPPLQPVSLSQAATIDETRSMRGVVRRRSPIIV